MPVRPTLSILALFPLALAACGTTPSGPAVPAPPAQAEAPGSDASLEALVPDGPGTLSPASLEWDATPPTITAVNPKNMATGSSTTWPITIWFSEPMNKASVEAAFKIVAPLNVTGSFSWFNGGTVMQFKPSQPFAHGMWVTYQMGAQARDLNGNPISGSSLYQTTYRVLRQRTVKIYSRPELDAGIEVNTTKNEINPFDGFGDQARWVGRDNHLALYNGWKWTSRNFYVFKLTDLPDLASLRKVNAATLRLYSTAYSGHPEDYGDLVLEQINQPFQGSLGWLWNAPLVSGGQTFHLGDPVGSANYSADITGQFAGNVKNRGAFFGLSQWRVRLEQDDQFKNYDDSEVELTMGDYPVKSIRPSIEVTYEYD